MLPNRRGEHSSGFEFLAANPPGWLNHGIALAASRCGAIGILNCEGQGPDALPAIGRAFERILKSGRGAIGLKIDAHSSRALVLASKPRQALDCIVVAGRKEQDSLIRAASPLCRRVFAEVFSVDQATAAVAAGAQGLIAKGHEAGGAVGEETAFVLLQSLMARFPDVPVFAHGGIGLHSAAAVYAAGAAGLWLESQLLLAAESSLPLKARALVERMEGDETVCLGLELGLLYRLAKRPGMGAAEELQRLEQQLIQSGSAGTNQEAWEDAIRSRLAWNQPASGVWPLGQDAVFAAPLARRFRTVSGIVGGLKDSIRRHIGLAKANPQLTPGGPLARSHSIEYPILQGPMTRVSDTAEFAAAVASNGALPFLALALLRAPQVRKLLARTKELMGTRSWGVGILGFVPSELRAEQLEAVREFRPPFAIIAGGRPDQAASLERDGIASYLHVPAPALLRMFLQDGARGFIFEGRECGGHVGPRTSFVLWDTMIDVLLDEINGGVPASDLRIIFAGGIHDARSAAMVEVMAAPLSERGVHVGVLMGTAYLFTDEAVQTGAIVEGFRQEALQCSKTVLLESGPGHATRCVETPFSETFRKHKRELISQKKSIGEIRDSLEDLNIGRLRVASKGITRAADSAGSGYVQVPPDAQRQDGMYMIGQVAALRGNACTMRDLHESVSRGSAAYLGGLPVPFEEKQETPVPPPCDVAIVGMSCLLPQAPDVRQFWTNIVNKVDAIREVPAERFNVDLYYDRDRNARDKIYSKWGGFLDDTPFDPMRYGIPPNALPSIDPMQLLSLVLVDRAMADAGYQDRDFPRERTSVILGMSGGLGDLGINYAVRSSLAQYLHHPPEKLLAQLPEWTEDSFAGILPNVTAGRVANRLDFGGVNFTVDAACASSLAAVYLATRELTDRTSEVVVVGGVDTVQSPFGYLCFSKSQALSPGGACRTFDATADGIAISEGITMLVLKRLQDAERDGDRVYAVIKGVAGSSDGRGRSMTAPRVEGQVSALRRAYAQAGFRAGTVALIEAHGTGTAAGDAAELAALSSVFQAEGAAPRSCSIGSVKSMIGHTKSAAGVTGLMKAALALYHRTLPPTLHVEQPNQKLLEPGSPFFVSTDAQPWVARSEKGEEIPRRAGVSSFGFGGTNFHAVLEEHCEHAVERRNFHVWPAELFTWRADSAEKLERILAEFPAADSGAVPFAELAAQVCARADGGAGNLRLAVAASSREDLAAKITAARGALQTGAETIDGDGIHLARADRPGQIAFLFPGQGSQKPGMMRAVSLAFPEMIESLDAADKAIHGRLPGRLSSYIYPPSPFGPSEAKKQMEEITDTAVAQPALGALEAGAIRLLARLGIRPDMTAGHSYGEYVALFAAGIIDENALIQLSEARGRVIKECSGADSGTMAAVAADASAVRNSLGEDSGVVLANLNCPRQTVISGPSEAVDTAIQTLSSAGLAAKRIPVACAFHSPLMRAASERLADVLGQQEFQTPHTLVFSNSTARPYPEDPVEVRGMLTGHLVNPVRFVDEIEAMYDRGARIFLEVGPGGVLTGFCRQILDGKPVTCLRLDNEKNPLNHFVDVLASLWARGVEIDTGELFSGRLGGAIESGASAGWLVNGGGAFPASRRRRPAEPLSLEAPHAPAPQAASADPAPLRAALPAMAVSGPETADAVMIEFQRLMGQFLETQSAVMTSFLGGTPADAPPKPVPSTPVVPATVPKETPLPLPEKRTERTGYAAEILRIASERTGYPPDMLALDAAIEADLGIDSIKRVEILTGFQRLCTPAEQAKIHPIMESLTAARTLREIANSISKALATDPAPEPAATPTGKRDYAEELCRIASERTGYPSHMLGLDAAIEADLGIDSIKRVEILTGFQRLCSTTEQAAIQAIMETLTAARTLREIASRITAAIPGDASVQAVAKRAEQKRDYAAELRQIAGERTGYPADMLALDAAIEADLGIDSIKRVEILTGFQRLCSAGEQAKIQMIMESLTAARTLREIASALTAALQPSEAVPAAEVPRCVLTTAALPRHSGGPRFYEGRLSIITDDECGIAAGFAEELERAGERALLLRHSPGAPLSANGVFSADLTDADAVAELASVIRKEYGTIGAVIHLLPLRVQSAPSDLSEWHNTLGLDLKCLYALARATEGDLKHTGQAGGALLAAITARGGEFGLVPGTYPLTHHAVGDFMKTVSMEFQGVACRVVDLDASDPVPILRQKLVDELCSADDRLQVGLPGDRRLTVVPRIAAIGSPPVRGIESDWVCLLTGGARGITAEIAKALARRARPVLILAGASALPSSEEPADTAGLEDGAALKAALLKRLRARGAGVKPAEVEASYQRLLKDRQIHQTLQSLRELGSLVEYHSVDVRDASAFGSLIEGIYTRHGRLDAVIHGAGIIEDKLLRDKTPASFDHVLLTKADSAFVLSLALRPESLKCLVFMSSISAMFGNRGQADYAAANGILNSLAVSLSSRWPGKIIAMNWGPWDQAGMVSEETRQQFLSRGVQVIPPASGAESALREIECGPLDQALVGLGGGPWLDHAGPSSAPHLQIAHAARSAG